MVVTQDSHARHNALFSVLIPAYGVQDFLDECLDSVLGQQGPPFEVVAVDDASPDRSGAILDARAAADDRLRVVHLDQNVGLGPARMVALEHARAPWVLFVDSDDTLAPGLLAALAERIAEAGETDERAPDVVEPDVVMFRFARWFPGTTGSELVPDTRDAVLAEPWAGRVLERPELIEIFPTAWNKAYRRDYLLAQGIIFPAGYYEDIPWTYPVLMSADPLVTLDVVGYHYRQRTSGTILSSSGRRHLDIFDQYERAFAFAASRPEADQWRRLLFDRVSRHLPTVLETPGRIPSDVREEFFHRASELLRRHRPRGYEPSGSAGVKVRLIERDDYRAFRAAQLANRVRRRLRGRSSA